MYLLIQEQSLICGAAALLHKLTIEACVALAGYHSQATYAWYLAGESLEEVTPLLYTDCDGVYECQVTCGGVTHSRSFRLTCEHFVFVDLRRSNCFHSCIYYSTRVECDSFKERKSLFILAVAKEVIL